MKRLIVAVVAVAFGIALAARAYGGTPFSRYRFDTGKNAPKLFYDAYRPIESGSHAEVAVVLIHGWGGHVRTLLPVFTKALSVRAGSEEKTPYVIAPQFPRHETIAANKEAEDGRAVWCDSWADEDKHPDQMGSASDDWRGCGSLDILGRPKTSLDMTPPAAAQGANRYERFRNFERYLDKYPEWKKQVSFHVFEGIAHKEDLCYPDPALLDFVFE